MISLGKVKRTFGSYKVKYSIFGKMETKEKSLKKEKSERGRET